jgi:ribosomal protein S18 acetylase RimI-like enzyme
MRHALMVSKERGFSQTGLMVNAKNRAAWSLYEKLGFQTEYRIMNRKES